MKLVHFCDTSLGYNCPNLKCQYKIFCFLRKDAYAEHRRLCNLEQGLGYAPLPHILSGSDKEVDWWMRVRCGQKKEIIKKLMGGTPWCTDLLEPVNI